MKFLSVCSGIEAASVAWNPLGWEAAAFSEIEPFPSAVLAHHYPHVPNWGDMTKYESWPHEPIDLLCGGTPCQSFSVAGLRKGLDDPRGNLMLTFGAIAAKYRPRWLVWENVPGVLSSNGGRDFGAFLGMLGQLGYGFAYRVLDAQYFGVAQRRRRVFVVGCLGDWRAAAAVLFERHSLQGHPAPRREAGQGAASGVEIGPGGGRFTDLNPTLDTRAKDGPIRNQLAGAVITSAVCPTLRAGGNQTGGDRPPGTDVDTCESLIAFHPTQDPISSTEVCHSIGANANATAAVAQSVNIYGGNKRADRPDGGFYVRMDEDTSKTLDAATGLNPTCSQGGTAVIAPAVAFQERGREGGRTLEIGGEVAYALTAPSGGGRAQERNVLTPTMQVRRLTPTECERLQGFPDGYTRIPNWTGWRALDENETPEQCRAEGLEVKQNKKTGKWRVKDVDGPRYKALGNSWAVPNVRWIGERIAAVDQITAQRMAA
jgi:DNA (cytosine-5)-methyltransferase 1